jgi:hypothetical protein
MSWVNLCPWSTYALQNSTASAPHLLSMEPLSLSEKNDNGALGRIREPFNGEADGSVKALTS